VLVHKSHKSRYLYILRDSSVSSMFEFGVGGWCSVLNEVIFLITMSIMTLEAVKFHLLFKYLHLFIFFLPLFAFENEGSDLGLL
jgi:hypothetical protein